MILDTLENADKYAKLHPQFAAAFAFLRRADLASLDKGRHEVAGDALYAMVVKGPGRGREAAKMEMHRRYIDIQYTVAGTDEIGWRTVCECVGGKGFDEAKDCELFDPAVDAWVKTKPGSFAIFFPEDGHAPMAGVGDLHKVVMKVRVV